MMQFSPFTYSQSPKVVSLFTEVFINAEGGEEGALIAALVSDLIETTAAADLLGFVAQDEGVIVGSIFFSRLILSSGQSSFILSPVAVATACQGQGIGQQLINCGIDDLKTKDIDIVVTYGDPRFYSKVGFKSIGEDVIKAPLVLSQPKGWLAQSLNNKVIIKPADASQCVAALNHQKYW